ncbi:MAG: hypothetical protein MJ214_05110 [Bacilli bacterium]|nr:hypothetical protein [Bacilli bacterium]
MANAKKGLRLLSFSIILNIGWSIAYAMLQSRSQDLGEAIIKFLSYGVLVTGVVLLICYVIDLVGLHIAGKDNKHFHRASFLKIASLVLAGVCLILGAVIIVNPGSRNTINTITSVINIFTAVAEVVVLTSIIKGCKEISPRVRGNANFVYVCFIIELAITIALSFMANTENPSEGLLLTIGALAIVFAIAAILYAVFYIILIFRTTKNVGKARKR